MIAARLFYSLLSRISILLAILGGDNAQKEANKRPRSRMQGMVEMSRLKGSSRLRLLAARKYNNSRERRPSKREVKEREEDGGGEMRDWKKAESVQAKWNCRTATLRINPRIGNTGCTTLIASCLKITFNCTMPSQANAMSLFMCLYLRGLASGISK
jgi:hypothetical protein